MNKIKWPKICLSFIIFTLMWKAPGFSQSGEKITVSTYYPSPYGSYQELRIFSKMTFKDNDGAPQPQDVDLTTDGQGDLILSRATNPTATEPIRLYFKDGGTSRPLSYFVSTSSSNLNPCVLGYVAVNFLKLDKTPADPKDFPLNGYYVCFRGE